MSGIEVVGVVLQAIPVAIETLKKYNEAIGEVKRWIRYKKEAQSLIRTLENERLRLENAYEKLLIGIVPPSLIEAMIADPGGPLWKADDIQRKVRARLWRSHKRFEEVTNEICGAMSEFEAKIAPLAEPGRRVSPFKRTSFTLSRADFAHEMETIKDGITSIEQMTMQNIELEPARRVRSQARFLNIFRDVSRSLFHALCSGLGCKGTHDISLRLESRSADDVSPGYADEEIMQDISFRLVFSTNDGDTHESSCWEEVIVKMAPPQSKEPVLPATVALPPPKPHSDPAQANSSKGMRMKAVSFGISSSSISSVTTVVATRVDPTDTGMQSSPSSLTMGIAGIRLSNLGITMNLCEKLRKAHKQKEVDSYGTIADHTAYVPRRYAVYPAPSPMGRGDGSAQSTVSLRDMLEHSPPPLYVRLKLAAVISSSVLQLHSTPWLSEPLSSTHILLQQENYPLHGHAFVAKKVPDCDTPPIALAPGDPAHMLRNPTLLYLGIVLIELILGQPFDSLRPKHQDENPLFAGSSVLADFMAAQKLLQQIRQTSANYGSAVSRCIHSDFGGGKARDLNDEDFRQEVYSSVVALIEKDLENA
ncbi:hypothetical protein GQ53DRAFT_740699 [Thozetella sp. PMI_491]|nr:hypothetical protein GQ53DRAFT_740699 [Thozetella sp. PMI_491]